RLSPKGYEIGLLGNSDWERFSQKRDRLAQLRNTLDNTRYKRSSKEYAGIAQVLGCDLGDSITLSQLSMRQGVTADFIHRLLPDEICSQIKVTELETALADSLYSGYIATQRNASERVNHFDNLKVPQNFHFNEISGLSHEMVERLERAKPQSFSQIRQINGLTPTAISTVLIYLTSRKTQQTT
ncbi:MAG TPA: hypothetical protein VNB22_13930, partial [Pyrinomonadaceae bacterium]|nr:hypothetical protein [Pyrinomonadaceae bacterium]